MGVSAALREAQDRVRAYLEIHQANPYQVDDIHGVVGMQGRALLRASDVRTLLDHSTGRTN